MVNKFLENLNPAQKRAATHIAGPLLVVAGAGTGKTTVLINRLAYLIIEKKVKMDEILLLTFTEKAAEEMSARSDKILPNAYLDVWISTFHGFGERILREFGLDIGLNVNFKLLTQNEQWILIKKNFEKFDLDYYRPLGNPTKFISELIRHFSRLKDENISAEDYLQYLEDLESNQDTRLSFNKPVKKVQIKKIQNIFDKKNIQEKNEIDIKRLKELAHAYQTYNQLLLENNFLDFGDLLIYTLKLFKRRPNILEFYRHQFKYIMVDEFQDTNWIQYELIKILALPQNNLMVVGDDDQAIYKFRGASLSNIMQFKDDYPESLEIVLTENYRSNQEILDYSYKFIQNNNPNRLETKLKIDKKLKAQEINNSKLLGESALKFLNFSNVDEELSYLVQEIRKLHSAAKDGSVSWSDFAILIRANKTAEAYVKELNRQKIPNQFMSWRGLYYKPLILDILAYFRLLDNYHESSALFRVLSMDIFKVDQLDLMNITKMAKKKVWSLYETLKNVNTIPGISPQSLKNINKLLSLIAKHSLLTADQGTSEIFLHFVNDSGFLANLDQDRDLEQFSYLNQFYQKIKRMEENEADLRLKDFLFAINLELEAGETGALKLDFIDNDSVKIMTIHGAKGLEFKYVFIVDLVDKKFPTISRREKIPLPDALVREKILVSGDIHLEEERRLFYVALTRAKERLYLTAAKDYGGAREKKPSRFITELGLDNSFNSDLNLSTKNEFLRDLHYFNSRELKLESKSDAINNYPLPTKFSFSQLTTYSSCPLQYKFAYILKIPVSSDKASLIFGSVVHNTLYNFLLPLLSERQEAQGNLFNASEKNKKIAAQQELKKSLTLKRLLALYQEFWQEDGYKNKEERAAYKLRGRQALKKFFVDFIANIPHKILFLEKEFSYRIGEDVLKGAIDRVDQLADGSLEIIDYKTGNPKDKLESKHKRQLILYQLFLEEFLNIKVSILSYYYLENGQKLSFTATPKDIDGLRSEVIDDIKEIKKRNFKAKPNPLCRYCDFRDICDFRQI